MALRGNQDYLVSVGRRRQAHLLHPSGITRLELLEQGRDCVWELRREQGGYSIIRESSRMRVFR